MQNCATYDNDGVELSDCTKINLIYGPNGSGKSTISNFFQNTSEPKYHNCLVEWTNNQKLDVLVYNKHFKETNISGDIDGVFSLGQEQVEEKKALESYEKRKDILFNKVQELKASLEKEDSKFMEHTENFQETIWKVILKENETDFKEAFTGYRVNKKVFLLKY